MYSVAVSPDQLADLYDAGTAGIIEHDTWLEAFFEGRETAERFGKPVECADTDWVRHTYDAWPPLEVGERFFVVAPWRTDPTPPGRLRLEIDPGMQCGTGQHRCTQLCLEAMERMIQPGDSVLDVGSGSGILSIAGKLLGAGRVIACDIDAAVAECATASAPTPVPFFIGSANAVRDGAFDVVVANIGEEVLGRLRPDLERVARRRILSGFQDEAGDWACLIL
jgi:ribosomal protein L11 methyltransferase